MEILIMIRVKHLLLFDYGNIPGTLTHTISIQVHSAKLMVTKKFGITTATEKYDYIGNGKK